MSSVHAVNKTTSLMNDSATHLELHIPVKTDEASIVALLADASGLSKQVIKRTMQNGAVWLTHGRNTRRVRRAKQGLASGDELHLYYDQAIQSSEPEAARVIADEGSYSVLLKPAGMYSQGSKWGDHCTIYRWAEKHFERPAFIVHRLDRAASGLILIAHTKTTATDLSRLFEQRQIKKTYRAVVNGEFPSESMRLESDIDGKEARSCVTLLRFKKVLDRSLVQVDIDTGRKHQIRRHLAEAGFPIVGDRLYGGHDSQENAALSTDKLQLVACYLSFKAPDSGEQKEYFVPDNLMPSSLACSTC